MNEPTLRELKSRSQKLKPVIHVGHDGITDALLAALDQTLTDHGLVKVRFTDHKSERKQLAAELAARTNSRQILLVGHTVTLYRTPVQQAVGI
ncbi:MAG: YhbY family RNA-binding protein [Chthoniobacterales bacterium]|jgi:RNA-binding protein